jgi:hypothetical protein
VRQPAHISQECLPVAANTFALPVYFALFKLDQARDRPEQAGLAAAIGTFDKQQLPLAHLEVQTLEKASFASEQTQVFTLQFHRQAYNSMLFMTFLISRMTAERRWFCLFIYPASLFPVFNHSLSWHSDLAPPARHSRFVQSNKLLTLIIRTQYPKTVGILTNGHAVN